MSSVYATTKSSTAMSTMMMTISSVLLSLGHVRTSISTSGDRWPATVMSTAPTRATQPPSLRLTSPPVLYAIDPSTQTRNTRAVMPRMRRPRAGLIHSGRRISRTPRISAMTPNAIAYSWMPAG
jgi:hypothetical protein